VSEALKKQLTLDYHEEQESDSARKNLSTAAKRHRIDQDKTQIESEISQPLVDESNLNLVKKILLNLVTALGPNCRISSSSGSTQTRTVPTGLTTRKTWTVGNRAVLQPKTRHFKFSILAPIEYLSSNRITT